MPLVVDKCNDEISRGLILRYGERFTGRAIFLAEKNVEQKWLLSENISKYVQISKLK